MNRRDGAPFRFIFPLPMTPSATDLASGSLLDPITTRL